MSHGKSRILFVVIMLKSHWYCHMRRAAYRNKYVLEKANNDQFSHSTDFHRHPSATDDACSLLLSPPPPLPHQQDCPHCIDGLPQQTVNVWELTSRENTPKTFHLLWWIITYQRLKSILLTFYRFSEIVLKKMCVGWQTIQYILVL